MFAIRNGARSDSVDGRDGSANPSRLGEKLETCWLPAMNRTHVRHSKRAISYLVKSLRAGSDSVYGRDGSANASRPGEKHPPYSFVETFNIVSGEESESRKRQRLRKGWIGETFNVVSGEESESRKRQRIRKGSIVETFDIVSGEESESRKRQRLRKGWIGQSIKTRREIKEP